MTPHITKCKLYEYVIVHYENDINNNNSSNSVYMNAETNGGKMNEWTGNFYRVLKSKPTNIELNLQHLAGTKT